MPSFTRSTFTALLAVLPAAQAHMSLWSPSMYGFNDGQASWPLADRSFNDWWFHGNRGSTPRETMSIIPGQTLNVEIACGKHSTSWGNNPSGDACPNDAGSFHAGGSTGSASGWGGNNDGALMGCALAIAYKSDVWSVNPEDFIVMSIQERCVRQRDTPFEIPANLPACPAGGCTCAWFWQGRNSAPEMYMTGFKCNVEGGSNATPPRPKEPRRNQVSGPTQPMYWGNDMSNIGYDGREWSSRPSYNSAWGWSNGAQNSAFEGLGGGNPNPPATSRTSQTTRGNGEATGTTTQGGAETTNTWTRSRTRTRSDESRPTDWQNLVGQPLNSTTTTTDGATTTNDIGTPAPTDGACKRRVKRNHKSKKRSHRHRRAGHESSNKL